MKRPRCVLPAEPCAQEPRPKMARRDPPWISTTGNTGIEPDVNGFQPAEWAVSSTYFDAELNLEWELWEHTARRLATDRRLPP